MAISLNFEFRLKAANSWYNVSCPRYRRAASFFSFALPPRENGFSMFVFTLVAPSARQICPIIVEPLDENDRVPRTGECGEREGPVRKESSLGFARVARTCTTHVKLNDVERSNLVPVSRIGAINYDYWYYY